MRSSTPCIHARPQPYKCWLLTQSLTQSPPHSLTHSLTHSLDSLTHPTPSSTPSLTAVSDLTPSREVTMTDQSASCNGSHSGVVNGGRRPMICEMGTAETSAQPSPPVSVPISASAPVLFCLCLCPLPPRLCLCSRFWCRLHLDLRHSLGGHTWQQRHNSDREFFGHPGPCSNLPTSPPTRSELGALKYYPSPKRRALL